jgi:hypothetical protein
MNESGNCQECSDWWKGYDKNILGWMTKPDKYPTKESTNFSVLAPVPPDGRCINNSEILLPCKLSFSFLIQAFDYGKYQYVQNYWSKEMTRTYLRTCCFGGDLITDLLENGNETTLPDLWQRHEEHGVELENFPDAPMHMQFLGITKHLLGNVDRLFNNNKKIFREFCRIISAHLQCGKDVNIDWCNLGEFSANAAISAVGWQSDQYLAYAWLSLVYFGLIEDYGNEIDNDRREAFQRVFVFWFMLLSALFTNNTCNAQFVDDFIRLFLSACICYGEATIKIVSATTKKRKSIGKAAFFEDTSNYFSLLNLKTLIEGFGSVQNLWE